MPFKLPKIALSSLAVLGVAGMMSACSSSKKVTASTATSTAATAPASTAPASTAPSTTAAASPFASAAAPSENPGFTVSIVKVPNNGGLALVGPNGHSLYLFDKDTATTSACTGGCADIWPGLKATGTPTVGPGLNSAQLGAASTGQVTYNNHLLYYFSPDKAPGDTNGVTIPGWHLVSPLGTPMTGR
jgi:predicted lipoprotein with Yx(FWY)xxD motif